MAALNLRLIFPVIAPATFSRMGFYLIHLSKTQGPLSSPKCGERRLWMGRKAISTGADHSPAELVEPRPRRAVAPQAQDSLQPQGAGAGLLAGHPPDDAEPPGQWLARALEDSPGGDGELVPAPCTVSLGAQVGCWPITSPGAGRNGYVRGCGNTNRTENHQ